MALEMSPRWTTTAVAPTRNAPFAGLSALAPEPVPQSKLAILIAGLGLIALAGAMRARYLEGRR